MSTDEDEGEDEGEGRASTGEDLEAEERVSRGVSPLPSKALG